MLGVGYHHAGVDLSDRKLIEKAFMLADLPVLCETLPQNFTCIITSVKHDLHFDFFVKLHTNRKDECHRLQLLNCTDVAVSFSCCNDKFCNLMVVSKCIQMQA